MNFATLSWIQYLDELLSVNFEAGFPIGNGSYMPWNIIEAFNNQSLYAIRLNSLESNKIFRFRVNAEELEQYQKFLNRNFIEPFKAMEIDSKESILLKTLILFQSEESLTEPGRS